MRSSPPMSCTKLRLIARPSPVPSRACRPALAHQALTVDPSIAAILPCNVVVRAVDETTTVVEAFDPQAMMALVDNDALHPVAADARERLTAALAALHPVEGGN